MRLHDVLKICEVDKLVSGVIIKPAAEPSHHNRYNMLYQAEDGVLGSFFVDISDDVDIRKPIYIHDLKSIISNTKPKFNKIYLQDDIQLIVERNTGSSSLLYESALGKSIYSFSPSSDAMVLPKISIDNYWLGILCSSMTADDDMNYIRISIPMDSNNEDPSYLPVTFTSYENIKNDYRMTNVNIMATAKPDEHIERGVHSLGTFNYNQFIKILKANKLAYSCDITIYIDRAMVMSFVYGNNINEIAIFSTSV